MVAGIFWAAEKVAVVEEKATQKAAAGSASRRWLGGGGGGICTVSGRRDAPPKWRRGSSNGIPPEKQTDRGLEEAPQRSEEGCAQVSRNKCCTSGRFLIVPKPMHLASEGEIGTSSKEIPRKKQRVS